MKIKQASKQKRQTKTRQIETRTNIFSKIKNINLENFTLKEKKKNITKKQLQDRAIFMFNIKLLQKSSNATTIKTMILQQM